MGPSAYMSRGDGYGQKMCHFISTYVVKVYGVKSVGDWLRNNKGKSFLDMMSMDDVAYCISLVDNSQDCWKQDVEVKAKSKEEQMNHRCWSDFDDPNQREKYRMVEPKYSGGKGVKRVFCGVMWNQEGESFYKEARARWEEDFMNKDVWQMVEVEWDNYVSQHGESGKALTHWRKRKRNRVFGDEEADGNEQGSSRMNMMMQGNIELSDDEDDEDGAEGNAEQSTLHTGEVDEIDNADQYGGGVDAMANNPFEMRMASTVDGDGEEVMNDEKLEEQLDDEENYDNLLSDNEIQRGKDCATKKVGTKKKGEKKKSTSNKPPPPPREPSRRQAGRKSKATIEDEREGNQEV